MTRRMLPGQRLTIAVLLALGSTFLSSESFSTTIECVSSGSGPAVGVDFVTAPFQADGEPDGIFVAWRNAQSQVASGLLNLDDDSFLAFPTESIAEGYISNLRVGVGGPTTQRRLYVTWVDNQLRLFLMAFDSAGNQIRAPHVVANSVQVVQVGTAGTDDGLILGYSWDSNFAWDPRSLPIDTNGNALVEEVAESVSMQTLGVDVAATASGEYAVAYMVGGGSFPPRIRRYDANGPLDAASIEFTGVAGPARSPFATLVEPSFGPPFWFVGLSHSSPAHSDDLRFAHAPLTSGPVTVGPILSDLEPAFPGFATDMTALQGGQGHVAVLWQIMERDENCLCSVPPPVRVEHFVQLIEAGTSATAAADLYSAYLWEDGDPDGPPLTLPVLAASGQTDGRFTMLWSDGVLRYKTLQVQSVTAVEKPAQLQRATLEPAAPNPFNPATVIRFLLSREGQARLSVYDPQGRRIKGLVDATLPEGEHRFTWDGTDDRGHRVVSGTYHARLEYGGRVFSTGLVLIK